MSNLNCSGFKLMLSLLSIRLLKDEIGTHQGVAEYLSRNHPICLLIFILILIVLAYLFFY